MLSEQQMSKELAKAADCFSMPVLPKKKILLGVLFKLQAGTIQRRQQRYRGGTLPDLHQDAGRPLVPQAWAHGLPPAPPPLLCLRQAMRLAAPHLQRVHNDFDTTASRAFKVIRDQQQRPMNLIDHALAHWKPFLEAETEQQCNPNCWQRRQIMQGHGNLTACMQSCASGTDSTMPQTIGRRSLLPLCLKGVRGDQETGSYTPCSGSARFLLPASRGWGMLAGAS